MILSKTPFRISFFGGGTDYPDYFNENPGSVLSATIDKYCYISCRYRPPFFSDKHRIVWNKIETIQSIAEISHPSVRATLEYLKFNDSIGLEIQHQADLPARSGIGSSSTFIVGLIRALMSLRGDIPFSSYELAEKAIIIERDIMHEPVGNQDQIAASYGGFNLIHFYSNKESNIKKFIVLKNIIPRARIRLLEENLILLYTGTSRYSSKISSNIIENIPIKKSILQQMYSLVDHGINILKYGNIDEFGYLLGQSWNLKKQLSFSVSNTIIDDIYYRAINNGALGGKLLGAGESGFMIFYVNKENQYKFRESMSDFLEVPFKFSRKGSIISYYQPEDRYAFDDDRY